MSHQLLLRQRHVCTAWMPRRCHTNASSTPRLRHVGATAVPHQCHVCTTWIPHQCHVSTTSAPRQHHVSTTSIGAAAIPVSTRQAPHGGSPSLHHQGPINSSRRTSLSWDVIHALWTRLVGGRPRLEAYLSMSSLLVLGCVTAFWASNLLSISMRTVGGCGSRGYSCSERIIAFHSDRPIAATDSSSDHI